jgi:hypothetical protein
VGGATAQTGNGIYFAPNTTSSLKVSNTMVSDNAVTGIQIIPTGSGTVTAVFNRVEINGNGIIGLLLNGQGSTGTVNGAVYDSVAAGNGVGAGGVGFLAETTPGSAPTTLTVFHSVAAYNNTGLQSVGSGATLRIAQSLVTGNAVGWTPGNGSSVLSDGDNTIEGNTSNETGPPTYARK